MYKIFSKIKKKFFIFISYLLHIKNITIVLHEIIEVLTKNMFKL